MFIVANVGVGDWRGEGGLLYQPVEQHSAGSRRAAVKAEGELVKVMVNVSGIYCPVVGAKQPPFE